jgi:hypothetical protein
MPQNRKTYQQYEVSVMAFTDQNEQMNWNLCTGWIPLFYETWAGRSMSKRNYFTDRLLGNA